MLHYEKLYHNLADGMDKAEALRQTKLEYIKSAKGVLEHPSFWSPFIQIGDSSQLVFLKKEVHCLGLLQEELFLAYWKYFKKKKKECCVILDS